jgi:hypothetical protein
MHGLLCEQHEDRGPDVATAGARPERMTSPEVTMTPSALATGHEPDAVVATPARLDDVCRHVAPFLEYRDIS